MEKGVYELGEGNPVIAGIKDEKTHRKKRGFRVSSPKTALSLQLDKVFIPV